MTDDERIGAIEREMHDIEERWGGRAITRTHGDAEYRRWCELGLERADILRAQRG